MKSYAEKMSRHNVYLGEKVVSTQVNLQISGSDKSSHKTVRWLTVGTAFGNRLRAPLALVEHKIKIQKFYLADKLMSKTGHLCKRRAIVRRGFVFISYPIML